MNFSLDPVVRMGRPADRKACLLYPETGCALILFFRVLFTPRLGEQDARGSVAGRTPGTRARAPGGLASHVAVAPFQLWEGNHSQTEEVER